MFPDMIHYNFTVWENAGKRGLMAHVEIANPNLPNRVEIIRMRKSWHTDRE